MGWDVKGELSALGSAFMLALFCIFKQVQYAFYPEQRMKDFGVR